MKANDRQIGGEHYKTTYQHWDLVLKVPMDYLAGCATKYVARWRKKEGVQDLKKGLHYLDKLIENPNFDRTMNLHLNETVSELMLFARANNLTEEEHVFISTLCVYSTKAELLEAREILESLIAAGEIKQIEEPNCPGTPDDGGHHDNVS